MSDLAAFLLARVAEREATARAASPGGWHYGDVSSIAGGMLYDETREIALVSYEQPGDHDGSIVRPLLSREADGNGAHIALNDPARILDDCGAVRRVVELHEDAWGQNLHTELGRVRQGGLHLALRALAAPYAEHPDYREQWAL